MLLVASWVAFFAHFIAFTLNLMSHGFLLDIADLLLMVDTPP
jgi:hypothetical protein